MGSRVELTALSHIEVRALVEVSADRDVFLSVYLPTASREGMEMASFFRSLVEAVRNALSGELEEDFDRTFAVAEELLPLAHRYGKEHVVIVGIVLGMLVMAASLILLARA